MPRRKHCVTRVCKVYTICKRTIRKRVIRRKHHRKHRRKHHRKHHRKHRRKHHRKHRRKHRNIGGWWNKHHERKVKGRKVRQMKLRKMNKLRKLKLAKRLRYTGVGWCETFHSCKKGDGRNFWAWTKKGGYKMHKGACARGNGKYGRRHKYWPGKFSFAQCKAKCDKMGKNCQGITMPKNITRK